MHSNTVEIDEKGHVSNVAFDYCLSSAHNNDEVIGYDKIDGNCLDEMLSVAEPLSEAHNIASPTLHSSRSAKTSIQSFLQTVPHLFTLTSEQIGSLRVMVREYGAMNVIIEEGLMLEHIYVLASGTVEVMNSKRGLKRAFGHRRIGSITAPNVFGIDDAILDKPAEFTYHASTNATLLLIPKDEFIELFAQSPIFANNVSSHILQTLPAFQIFQDFCRSLFGLSTALTDVYSDLTEETHRISLPTIINLYKSMNTVVHKYADSNAIDAEALRYCVRRLPENVTETYIIILTNTLPDFISNGFLADAAVASYSPQFMSTIPVDTGKRRRCAWKIGSNHGSGGQTLIVMRDGFTDMIDFMSSLSMFIIEARKLRARMQQLVSPSAMEILCEAIARSPRQAENLQTPPYNNNNNNSNNNSNNTIPQVELEYCTLIEHDIERREHQMHKEVCMRLGFTFAEVEALQVTWGDRVIDQLYNILVQREEYVVQLQSSSVKRFAQDVYACWGLTIMRHIKSCMQISDYEDLPEDIIIDVLFSPNRTLKNLFCSMLREFKELIDHEHRRALLAHHKHTSGNATVSLQTRDANYNYRHHLSPSFPSSSFPSAINNNNSSSNNNNDKHQTFSNHDGRALDTVRVAERSNQTEEQRTKSTTAITTTGTSSSSSFATSVANKEHAIGGPWKNDEDRYYYILTQMLERDETVRNAYRARLEGNGFALMEDAHSSALLVDCIDVSQICVEDIDSALRDCAEKAKFRSQNTPHHHFILNVDKSFGTQIESILRALLLMFGNRIRSVNLMGKAAGLVGNRGDVVLPSKLIFSKQSFGEDSTDEIRLCNRNTLRYDDIAPFMGKSCSSAVHEGTCLTLPGFIMQSESVLKFYKIVHGCVASEMQSSYVARQLEECRRTGILHKTIPSRYLFYFDDMPLGNEDGSELKPRKREIISTIYATARSLLGKILTTSSSSSSSAESSS